jgi:hypothetical protein
MEATTSSATESDKMITCPVAAGCLIPELQANAIPFGALAVGMEHLAAGGIGAWKNPVRSCH